MKTTTKNQGKNDKNAERIQELNAVLAGMAEVDALISAGDKTEAQNVLFSLWCRATAILGGNQEVRDLLDRANTEVNKRFFGPLANR